MHKLIQFLFESIGWIKIMLSPILITSLLNIILFSMFTHPFILVLGLCLSLFGLVLGIYLANKAWKKTGTMNFLSRPMFMPELENNQEKDFD